MNARILPPDNRQLIKFVLLFSLFIIGAHLVIFLLQITSLLEILNVATATLTGFFINLLGAPVVQTQETLTWGNFSLQVIAECTGLFLFIVYLGAVLSYPTTWENKFKGILALPLLIFLNIFRLVVLLLVGRFYPVAFDFIHHYLWQTTFIIIVIAFWIIWLEWVVKTEK